MEDSKLKVPASKNIETAVFVKLVSGKGVN
jgi:hypothetical protein